MNNKKTLKLQKIFIKAVSIARKNNQKTGEKNDYFITIQQLNLLIEDEE